MNAPAKDVLVTLGGLATSFLTAAILALIQVKAHFAVYAFTFLLVIPIGAIIAGGVASSGYMFASKFLNHPLHRFFAINIVGVSIVTFFVLYYFVFRMLVLPNGQHIAEVLSFSRFLDLIIQNRKVAVLGVTTISSPGLWGYLLTAIHIVGFAFGGFYVYRNIASQPFCEACKSYLVEKSKATAYGGLELQHEYGTVLERVRQGEISEALHKVSTLQSATDSNYLMTLRHSACAGCSRQFYSLGIDTRSGNKWEAEPAFQSRGQLHTGDTPPLENVLGHAHSTNPSNAQIAVSLSVVVVAAAGFFLVKAMHPEDSNRFVAEASQYMTGRGVARDENRAFADMRKAADMGNTLGMIGVAAMYAEGRGVSRDDKQALTWYRKAAEAGNSNGMDLLAVMIENGRGAPADGKQAAEWYQRSAALGNADAMNHLGVLYLNGKGVSKDVNKAAEYFSQSAEKGNLAGRHNVGVVAMQAKPPDFNKAVTAFQLAAKGGYLLSMRALALMYLQGTGVARDYGKAREWLTAAADRRDLDAMFTLGMMDLVGQGGPRNPSAARQWFEKAAKAGHGPASQALDAMDAKNPKAR